MDDEHVFEIHHGGEWLNGRPGLYQGGKTHLTDAIDSDKFGYFEMVYIVRDELKYPGGKFRLYHGIPNSEYVGLLESDGTVMNLFNLYRGRFFIPIYVEHLESVEGGIQPPVAEADDLIEASYDATGECPPPSQSQPIDVDALNDDHDRGSVAARLKDRLLKGKDVQSSPESDEDRFEDTVAYRLSKMLNNSKKEGKITRKKVAAKKRRRHVKLNVANDAEDEPIRGPAEADDAETTLEDTRLDDTTLEGTRLDDTTLEGVFFADEANEVGEYSAEAEATDYDNEYEGIMEEDIDAWDDSDSEAEAEAEAEAANDETCWNGEA